MFLFALDKLILICYANYPFKKKQKILLKCPSSHHRQVAPGLCDRKVAVASTNLHLFPLGWEFEDQIPATEKEARVGGETIR